MHGSRAIPVVGSLALAAALLLPGAVTSVGAEEAAAGFEAHVDPETGEFVEQPAGLPRGLAGDQAATATDGTPLRQERGPAGGVSVELRGALRSSVTATVGPDGQAHTRCDGGQHPAHAPQVCE
jgi:hypothetical protein